MFKPLEWSFNRNLKREAYVKLLVNKESRKVEGFHILAPNAGDVTQGVGIAMQCGVTKEVLDQTVGIHPTVAEDVIGLKFTKEENPDATKGGC